MAASVIRYPGRRAGRIFRFSRYLFLRGRDILDRNTPICGLSWQTCLAAIGPDRQINR